MRKRLLAAAVETVSLVGLAGCFLPSEPFAPVAVSMQGMIPEVRYTACKPAKLMQARVISVKPGARVIDGPEPVLWQVSFAQPVTVTSLTIGGAVPDGGVVDFPLAQPLDASTEYEAFLQLDDGTNPHEGFQLDKLKGGHVSFQDKYVTIEEFNKLAACS